MNPHAWVCEKKRRFTDEIAARINGMATISRNPVGVERLWPYKCMHCNGWHLTKKPNDRESISAASSVEEE